MTPSGHADGGVADALQVALGQFDYVLRRGLTGILRDDETIRLVGEDLNASGLERAMERHGDVVLLVDEAFVHEAVRRWVSSSPRLLVLARAPSRPYGRCLTACGVSCVSWQSTATELLGAIHHTGARRPVFLSRCATQGFDQECHLTVKEIAVLTLMSEGRKNAEIAFRLQIRSSTVRTYTERLVAKLEAGSRRDLLGLPVPAWAHIQLVPPGRSAPTRQ